MVATMFSIYAFIIAGGRVVGGMLADHMPLNVLLAMSLMCQCAALISLNKVDPQWLPWVFPMCSAAGSSLLMSVGETMWVRYYGRRHLGKIRGSVSTIGVAASGVGPFVMGVAFVVLTAKGADRMIVFAMTGVLGGFTTFSAFSLDTVTLMTRGETAYAMIYVAVSIIFSIAALWVGMTVTQAAIS